MELYRKYRETTLDGILGNHNSKETLKSIIAKPVESRPHTFLFVGPAGCGKTTLAYIMAAEFKVQNIIEQNSADYRGIDSVRDFAAALQYVPLQGSQAYIFEECFHKDTLVVTDKGEKPISTIQEGDTVVNAIGLNEVTHVWEAKVHPTKVVRINYDRKHIICSRNHRIFTSTGWKFAGDITTSDLICLTSYAMLSQTGSKKENYAKSTNDVSGNMSRMWFPLYLSQTEQSLLLESVWNEVSPEAKTDYIKTLPPMREGVSSVSGATRATLLNVLCVDHPKPETGVSSDAPVTGEGTASSQGCDRILSDGVGEIGSATVIRANEKEQPRLYAGGYEQGNSNPQAEQNTEHARAASDMHKLDRQDGTAVNTSGTVGGRVVNGTCDSILQSEASLVEDRRCEPNADDCGGGRRANAQLSIPATQGCNETGRPVFTRVEAVSVYQPGDSLEYFGMCAEDTRRGYVTFYDLSIAGHPSYIANSALVHNCHRLTQDAQEALLKPVENCPEHTYLFFTTTDASKINAALKTRMIIIPVEPLDETTLESLVKSVCVKEQITITDDVIKHIAKSAYNSPRRALTMLEKVIGLSEEEQLKVAGYSNDVETVAIDLCRLLIKKSEWMTIANVLSTLSVEPEAVRRAVLGYMRAVLLKKDSAAAVVVATHFERNYYDSGNVGLVLSCYRAWVDLKG